MAAKKPPAASAHECACTRSAADAEASLGVPFASLGEEEKYRIALQRIEEDPFLGTLLAAARDIDARESASPEKKNRRRKSASSTPARKTPR